MALLLESGRLVQYAIGLLEEFTSVICKGVYLPAGGSTSEYGIQQYSYHTPNSAVTIGI